MLILNPVSGKQQGNTVLGKVLETFSTGGFITTVYFTEYAGHATDLAREHAKDYHTIVCIGGDGTFAETVSGLITAEADCPLGYIPLGTTNDMATTLGLPKNPLRAAKAIVLGNTRPLDIGTMGDEHFTYISAFGAFTEVSYQTPTANKKLLGHLAYMFEGMGKLGKLSPIRVVVQLDDQPPIEDDFLFGGVVNTTSIAGVVKLDPALVDLSDGLFEVLLVKNPKNFLEGSQILGEIMTKNYNPEHITLTRASRVRFFFTKPTAFTRDGEDGGKHIEVEIGNLKQAVTVFIP